MVPALVLATLVLAAGTLGRTGRTGAVLRAVVSLAWLLVTKPVEGVILFSVTSTHGLVGADLAGLAGLALAGWQILRPARSGRARR